MNRLDRSTVVVLAVVLAALLPAAALVGLHLAGPFDGAIIGEGRQAWTRDGIIVTGLDERPGGLRDGDIVVAVAGRSLEEWAGDLFHPGRWHAELRRGETAIYTIERADRPRDLTVELGSYPLGSVLARNWGSSRPSSACNSSAPLSSSSATPSRRPARCCSSDRRHSPRRSTSWVPKSAILSTDRASGSINGSPTAASR